MNIEEQLISEFSKLSDWEHRYIKIINIGKQLPNFPDQYKTSNNLIKGCNSNVWLFYDGRVFHADSDTLITKGLIALLLISIRGKSKTEIKNSSFEILKGIKMERHFSPSRNNGLLSMVAAIKKAASQ